MEGSGWPADVDDFCMEGFAICLLGAVLRLANVDVISIRLEVLGHLRLSLIYLHILRYNWTARAKVHQCKSLFVNDLSSLSASRLAFSVVE